MKRTLILAFSLLFVGVATGSAGNQWTQYTLVPGGPAAIFDGTPIACAAANSRAWSLLPSGKVARTPSKTPIAWSLCSWRDATGKMIVAGRVLLVGEWGKATMVATTFLKKNGTLDDLQQYFILGKFPAAFSLPTLTKQQRLLQKAIVVKDDGPVQVKGARDLKLFCSRDPVNEAGDLTVSCGVIRGASLWFFTPFSGEDWQLLLGNSVVLSGEEPIK